MGAYAPCPKVRNFSLGVRKILLWVRNRIKIGNGTQIASPVFKDFPLKTGGFLFFFLFPGIFSKNTRLKLRGMLFLK